MTSQKFGGISAMILYDTFNMRNMKPIGFKDSQALNWYIFPYMLDYYSVNPDLWFLYEKELASLAYQCWSSIGEGQLSNCQELTGKLQHSGHLFRIYNPFF
jgi:hypothetical protein